MAALSVADRSRVWRGLMRRWSKDHELCSFSKQALYDSNANAGAVADIDNWVETHSGNTGDTVGFNGALAVPMRTALLAVQKTDLLIAITAMKRGVEYVRSVFGEVD